MDIASIAASAKSAAVLTDGPADTPGKKRLSLSNAVNRHLMRKKWLKVWGEERSKGPVVEVLTSMVKKTKADDTGMWGSIIDAAIAAVPAPLPAGRQLVTVFPPYQGRQRITRDEYAAAVEAPTKEGWWFTPKTGWPKDVVYAGGRPADLMPTEEMAEPGFFLPDDALGELRVEVLECDGLPSMDFGGWDENDVYALLVFEGTVAKTRMIMDVDNPRWHCECARGFKLPIRSASSALHVALFDSDEDSSLNTLAGGLASSRRLLSRELSDLGKGVVEGVSPGRPDDRSAGGGAAGASGSSPLKDLNGGAAGGGAAGGRTASGDTEAAKAGNMMKDDPIGRLVIEPRRLVPGTSYDSWFELRRSTVLDDAGQFGAVRLRLSNASCLPPALALTSGPDSPPPRPPLLPQLRLRYSVVWASERLRLRAALSPPKRETTGQDAAFQSPLASLTLSSTSQRSFGIFQSASLRFTFFFSSDPSRQTSSRSVKLSSSISKSRLAFGGIFGGEPDAP